MAAQGPETSRDVSDAISAAEAEAAEAEARAAEARARAARARADEARLRAIGESVPDSSESPDEPDPAAAPAGPARRRRIARAAAAGTGVVVAVAVVLGLLGASGYIIREHHDVEANRKQAAEYAAAARQGVVNLMVINHKTAEADVQRVLDSATGNFKENFEATSEDLVKALADSDVVTDVDVKDVAIESMTGDSAVVLVAVISQRGEPNAADRDPRTWRAVVTVARDGDQLKISNLEFA